MEFTQDPKDHRICALCQNPMFRVIAKNGDKPTVLGIPLFEVSNLLRGAATDRPEVFYVKVYECLNCHHLDFYASDVATSLSR